MKKFMSLLLTLVFVGSMMVVAGCTPKQEATEAAPTMEAAPEANTSAAEAVPAAAPAAGETAPAAAE